MKRERDEESEDEVFERRRKVHRQEKTSKDEIEDLFAHSSESAGERSEEEVEDGQWGLGGAVRAGVLLEIFGDGTDYVKVLESLSLVNSSGLTKLDKTDSLDRVSSSFGLDKSLDKEGSSKTLDKNLVVEAVQRLVEMGCILGETELEEFVTSLVAGENRVEALAKVYPLIPSAAEMFSLTAVEEVLASVTDKAKIISRWPVAQHPETKALVRLAKQLKTPAECNRMHRHLQVLDSTATEQERKLALFIAQQVSDIRDELSGDELSNVRDGDVRDSLNNGDNRDSDNLSDNLSGDKISIKVLGDSPWLRRLAIDIGMNVSSIVLGGGTGASTIPASHVAGTDLYLLQALKPRGLTYQVVLNPLETQKQILQKLAGSGLVGLDKLIEEFLMEYRMDIEMGVERGLCGFAEETVRASLFVKVLDLASLNCDRLWVKAFWLTRGWFRHTLLDAKENKVSNGPADPGVSQSAEETSTSTPLMAFTGRGHKLKSYLRKRDSVFVPEDLLDRTDRAKDLSLALALFLKHPVSSLGRILRSGQSLPSLVPFQDRLKPDRVAKIWQLALDVAEARIWLYQSTEYLALKKDLLEYLKSGGDVCSLDCSMNASLAQIKTQIRQTPVPYAKWTLPLEEPAIENKILREAYLQCVHRLQGTLEYPRLVITPREEFRWVTGLSEESLLALETSWTLSAGAEISLPGLVVEGAVAYIGTDTQVQLSTGSRASLRSAGSNLVVGQRLKLQVVETDLVHQKIIVQEQQSAGGPSLRAQSHWRVKNVGAKGVLRLLKDKSFGDYVLRISTSYQNSLILTVRLTERMEECLCGYIHLKELPNGYEVEGRKWDSIDTILNQYLPNYLKSLKRVLSHRQFSIDSPEQLLNEAKTLATTKSSTNSTQFMAFALSRSQPGMVSFVYIPSGHVPVALTLYPVENGMVFQGRLFTRPDEFIQYVQAMRPLPATTNSK
ncbi:hypothetical protein NEHOM01_1802 [Nematocida homosporus]|uniref:uncharacterized protein n=1 Tax=Nematocida homosporus TaxID=1912981 RepID=UPI0022207234|nr:uncharacterized protein NEHOM01_1802 [Nematocida homosporus]KAI5186918.1 hypothetical protein NEHOM01_1802 [Nematocida homosporus]